jgi:hypothetical protein
VARRQSDGSTRTIVSLRSVAASHLDVRVLDLGAYTSIDGHFSARMNGIQIRAADGIHFTRAGDPWLQPWLLSRLASIGTQERRRGPPLSIPMPA